MRDRPRRRRLAAILAATAAAASAPNVARAQEGWQFGPSLEMRHPGSGFRMRVNGYVHGDLRSRRNFTDAEDEGETRNGTETQVRRTRIGISGEWGRVTFLGSVDPRDEREELKDLYAEVRIATALRIRGGHIKMPGSPEFAMSVTRTDFVERSMVSQHLGNARDWGVMASGAPFRRFGYMAAVLAGENRTQRSQTERLVAARLTYTPLPELELGTSWSDGDVHAGVGEGSERGLQGVGPSQFSFFTRQFVDGRRRRLGADARWARGRLGLRGEWLRVTEERQGQGTALEDLPDQIAEGWFASATWLVTGEKKTAAIKPARALRKGGPGAIEIGVRYESLAFDDNRNEAAIAADRAFTAGVSWWPEGWLRLMGNVVLERFDDAASAPDPGRAGEYVTLLGRVQLQIP